jgi:thymidylate synthase
VRGETNNKLLKEQNVHIWDGNASKKFLQSRGLNYEEDDLGPVYGFQWRNFNGNYKNHKDYDNNGIDQLNYIIELLKNDGTNDNIINKNY